MPLGLRDLLERIRPAGAPGAPAGGAVPADRESAGELAALRAVLDDLDAAARRIIEADRHEADELLHRAESEARSIRSALPDRLARIGDAESRASERLVEGRLAEVDAETSGAIDRRRRAADAHADRIVRAALDTIWSAAELVGDDGR